MNTVNSQNRIIQRLKEFGRRNVNNQKNNQLRTGTLFSACDERSNGQLFKNQEGIAKVHRDESVRHGSRKQVKAEQKSFHKKIDSFGFCRYKCRYK
jgi:hypothetical protein